MPTQKMQCIFCIEDFKKKKRCLHRRCSVYSRKALSTSALNLSISKAQSLTTLEHQEFSFEVPGE